MQRDLVLRWLQQISALLARLLRRDPTLSLQIVEDELTAARGMLLGPLAALLPYLPPSQAAELLVDPFRTYGYAQLLGLESALERARGRNEQAEILRERAIALVRLAIERADPVPHEWSAWLAQLTAEEERPA